MADLDRVRRWADALIVLHLDLTWTFAFDNAKKRAGLCNYTVRRITVSRYLAARYDDDEVHQILLHEVAHALAGPRAGHGPKWKAVASGLGYDGKRTHDGEIADELAPWVGVCPAGHIHYRYRQPTRAFACGLCGKGFNRAHLIDWNRREITAAARRRAAAATVAGTR
ncbi:putative SprT family Zn-dependent metalloprotease [Cryobacterium sp. MP_M5]|uniref:SprT-like domain-containing protein n=1 Tax=unclassified Cryobacterium TaxID=2649013 RepID=UPI0018CA3850|nr:MULTISPECIES: SprT-like domain-containing protein [unclassified Cryobacterium]MBG6056960.1 putative SprT family Zn-dependent metalloprotease [Cryobacterium sp. MP_M3]MEC5175159.1 putative SprT family Zn-dependent metalloprotease [Cryobacterium sp. MP_M5]